MILWIVVYRIKKRWWYIMNFPIYSFLTVILVSAIAPKMGVWFSVFLTMAAAIVLSVPFVSKLSRSEIDFVFSTPADPRLIFIWTFLADWFLYSLGFSLGFILYTHAALHFHMPIVLYAALLQRPADPFLYIASIAVPAATLGVFVRVFSFLSFEELAWLVPIAGAALLTVELVHPSPYWIAITSLIITLVYLPLQEYYTRELYTNAYGLLERLLPRPQSVASGPMPRSLWELVWRTTYSGGRKRALAVAASISATGVVAYLVPVFLPPSPDVDSQEFALMFATLAMLPLLWDWHSSGLSSERLWISFSADHYAYVRYRMAARSLASLLATSPWIFAYALASLRYPSAAHAAASLVSASLAFPILAWLIEAFRSRPQIREHGLVQRPVRYTAKSLLSLLLGTAKLLLFPLLDLLTIGLYLAPTLLAAAGYSAPAVWLLASVVVFSAAFFYIALFTRLGRGLWDWLVDRLVAAGYV